MTRGVLRRRAARRYHETMGEGRRWLWALAFLISLAEPLRAASSGVNFLALDAGLFANNVVGRANALAVDKPEVSHFSVYVRLRRGLHLGKGFYFEPAFSTLIPWYSGVDGSTKQFTFHTDFPLLVPVFSFLHLRLGPGLEWQLLTSSGASIVLDNGTSTETFYTPAGVRLIALATVGLGLGIRLSRKIGLNVDVTVLSVASPTRRSYQASAGLGVYL